MLQSHKLANDRTLQLTQAPADEDEMEGNVLRWQTYAETLGTHPFDWRNEDMVSEVKDQGTCGAGYAFAVVGALESLRAIQYGAVVNLSTQQILDCDRGYNDGCAGGAMSYAMNYTLDNGLMTEAHYPYTSSDYLGSEDNTCGFMSDLAFFSPDYVYQLPRARPDLLLDAIL
jgi:hypothetical protein